MRRVYHIRQVAATPIRRYLDNRQLHITPIVNYHHSEPTWKSSRLSRTCCPGHLFADVLSATPPPDAHDLPPPISTHQSYPHSLHPHSSHQWFRRPALPTTQPPTPLPSQPLPRSKTPAHTTCEQHLTEIPRVECHKMPYFRSYNMGEEFFRHMGLVSTRQKRLRAALRMTFGSLPCSLFPIPCPFPFALSRFRDYIVPSLPTRKESRPMHPVSAGRLCHVLP